MTEDDMRENSDEISDWFYVSANKKLSEDFIREFRSKVVWDCISSHQKLSEEFIREFHNVLNWDDISRNQKLSEEFIREFQNVLDWDDISRYQKLSEDFIREFKNKLNLFIVLCYQKLSRKFIQELEKDLDELISSKDRQQIFSGFITLGCLRYLDKYEKILNCKVSHNDEIDIKFNYPMKNEVTFKFKNNFNEPITFLDLFYFIRKGYVRIYKEEHEKCTKVKPFSSPYHRPETNGPYGIYAHGWETLSIEIIYKHGDVFTLVMGS
jgi:Zn-finger protein